MQLHRKGCKVNSTVVSSDFYENCDKSVKGTKICYTLLNKKKDWDTRDLDFFVQAILDFISLVQCKVEI